MRDFFVSILFFVIGISFLAAAISAKLGGLKGIFMLTINPITPVSIIYAAIPLGLGSILTGIGGMIADIHVTRWFIGTGLGGGVILGYIFIFWKPRWLKPDWLLWLEDHYDRAMLDLMFEQARQDKNWGQKVETQAGLESWAKEMEQKFRYYRDDW